MKFNNNQIELDMSEPMVIAIGYIKGKEAKQESIQRVYAMIGPQMKWEIICENGGHSETTGPHRESMGPHEIIDQVN